MVKRKSKTSKKHKGHIAKLGAIELSMTTIVIIVISIIVLIFGIIFARSVMCSGIQITQEVDSAVKNQLKVLFGADKYGVNCMGEGSQEVKLGTGGRRKIICMIKVEDETDYNIKVTRVESLKGATDSIVDKWIIDQDWTGTVSPGGDGTEANVLMLDIPADAPTTTLKIKIQKMNQRSGSTQTSYSVIDIVPTGFIRSTVC
jgi:hypothetical protein